jgi:hypothetical protein
VEARSKLKAQIAPIPMQILLRADSAGYSQVMARIQVIPQFGYLEWR